jgi:hypothetical protein
MFQLGKLVYGQLMQQITYSSMMVSNVFNDLQSS